MAMPGKPAPMGAEGQINVPSPWEARESVGDRTESGDDRVSVTVGAQQHGPNAPAHGAAGGIDVDFASVAPPSFEPDSIDAHALPMPLA